MKATRRLHEMGQSLWLDNITRGLLRCVAQAVRECLNEPPHRASKEGRT